MLVHRDSVNSQGLGQLTEADLAQSRVAYSWHLPAMSPLTDELHAAWAVDEGNFVAGFANAGLVTACTALRRGAERPI